jgi:hypothetical protein
VVRTGGSLRAAAIEQVLEPAPGIS